MVFYSSHVELLSKALYVYILVYLYTKMNSILNFHYPRNKRHGRNLILICTAWAPCSFWPFVEQKFAENLQYSHMHAWFLRYESFFLPTGQCDMVNLWVTLNIAVVIIRIEFGILPYGYASRQQTLKITF